MAAHTSTKAQKRRVLIISHDKIGSQMAGPGIRYHYMAEELARHFDVTVGFFDPTYLPDDAFAHSYNVQHIDAHRFEPGFEGYAVVIALWLSEAMLAYCNQRDIFTVFDVYAPVPVENLASMLFSGRAIKPEQDFEYQSSLAMYRKFFENGDLFLLSNPRQIDFWTGYVFGADQVRPSTYPNRTFYDRFILAPMGIDTTKPLEHTKNVMRGVLPGVTDTDHILLWTGGIWGWYDGQVLMRAMKRLAGKHPGIKLVFFGTQHPNPNVPEMQESFLTRQLAADFGLLDKTVFFKDGWTPYHDRINYLLEANVAVNTHKMSIETEFSHRTRVLDHLLAGLPTIGTQGDYLSDSVISQHNLGITVPAGDEAALEKAILDILELRRYQQVKANLAAIRPSYDWSETLKPLVTALESNLPKLQRIAAPKTLPRRQAPAVRLAKRYMPVPMKKMIIRTLYRGRPVS